MGKLYTFVSASGVFSDKTISVWLPTKTEIESANSKLQSLETTFNLRINQIANEHKELQLKNVKNCDELNSVKSRLDAMEKTFTALRQNLSTELEQALKDALDKTLNQHFELLANFCKAFPKLENVKLKLAELELLSDKVAKISEELEKLKAQDL